MNKSLSYVTIMLLIQTVNQQIPGNRLFQCSLLYAHVSLFIVCIRHAYGKLPDSSSHDSSSDYEADYNSKMRERQQAKDKNRQGTSRRKASRKKNDQNRQGTPRRKASEKKNDQKRKGTPRRNASGRKSTKTYTEKSVYTPGELEELDALGLPGPVTAENRKKILDRAHRNLKTPMEACAVCNQFFFEDRKSPTMHELREAPSGT